MRITDEIRAFADRFAASVKGRDYQRAHSMLASWLQAEITADALQNEIETRLREMADAFEFEDLIYPDSHELDNGVLSADDLRQPGMADKPVPDQLTAENFLLWMCIQFQSQDDSVDVDAWFDWWMAVAREQDGLVIGYFEIQDPD